MDNGDLVNGIFSLIFGSAVMYIGLYNMILYGCGVYLLPTIVGFILILIGAWFMLLDNGGGE